jgi:acetyl esterase/lipase
MKKNDFLIIAFILLTITGNATIYSDETFNYSASNLSAESSWTTAGTLTTGTGRNIITSPLTYSANGKTYILSGVGNTLNSDISSCTDYKSYKPFSASAINSGSVYLSFMYKAGVAQSQTNSEVMGLSDGINQGPRIWVGKGVSNAANYRIGLTRGITTGGSVIWGATEYSDVAATILVVIKYDFATSTASVFINPALGSSSEPTADIIDNSTTTFRTQLNNLWFRSQGSSVVKFNVGGIRVASSWVEVTADKNTPKLATPVIGNATNITATGFTANWTPVANAISYDVKVYQGTTLVTTKNAIGQASSTIAVTGLSSGTEYTYKVMAKGNDADYSNSDESLASLAFSTSGVNSIEKISTDFGDGTWGTIATTAYASGNYPSSTINGFNLIKAYFYTGSVTCETGEVHTNRLLLGKSSESATVEFPVLKTVGEVEIHATTGSEAMSFRLEEWTNNQWLTLETLTTRKSPDSIYVIPVLRNAETRLRIANNTSSGLYVYKIVTRTYQEATELTLRASSPTENEVCFANLKKEITLTFNKNIQKASGTILLNGVSIPLTNCTINSNVVSIPVSLENIPGANKAYTLSVSAVAFAEVGNVTNLSKAVSVNFQTLKSVVYPSNYSALLDVVYKNVNSSNTRMDVYYPTNVTTPVPVVINMHGGGWSGGFKEEQGGFTMYFNRNYAVVNVEYRLRGEALAPACVEDVRGALNYVLNHAQAWNIDVNKVIFQGGSAGGHLALMGAYLQNNRIYDNDCVQYTNPIKIMAIVDKYGPCDFTQLMSYSSLIAWTGPRFTDQTFLNSLAPITYVNANTPPTYIIHGDADPTIPYNQSVTLYAALQNAGVKSKFTTVPNGVHGSFPTEYNTQMETEILQFIDEVLTNQSTAITAPKIGNINIKKIGNTVNIISSLPTTTIVYNSLGKEVISTTANSVNLNNKGFYIVKTENTEAKLTTKITIQ